MTNKRQKNRNSGTGTSNMLSLPPLIFFIALFLITISIFWPSLTNYFVGDDFTWLRWSRDCQKLSAAPECGTLGSIVRLFFIDANGFFYRPGTKLYFYLMNQLFSLNQVAYHAVSVSIHFLNAVMIYFLSIRIFEAKIPAYITAFLFLILNVHSETIYWISSINHLAASSFILAGLVFYILFQESKRLYFAVISFFCVFSAPLFHEIGITAPFFIIGYVFVTKFRNIKTIKQKWIFFLYLLQIPIYLFFRYTAQSHWLSGDYNYSLTNLPFNVIGNAIGYVGLTVIGNNFLSAYSEIRITAREHVDLTIVVLGMFIFLVGLLLFSLRRTIKEFDYSLVLVSAVFFFVPLLPFLGLGNITNRYAYLASFGILLFIVWIVQRGMYKLPKRYKSVTITGIFLVLSIVSYYNISELRRMQADWERAGKMALTVFDTISRTAKIAGHEKPTYYFVNVPIRYGEAWVFPVGLEDAVWVANHGKEVVIKRGMTQNEARVDAELSENATIIVFDESGLTDPETIKKND